MGHNLQTIKFRVLVADDDDDCRDALAEALKRRGYEVREAADGEEALYHIQHEDLHLNLLDYNMPGVTGLEILRRLHLLHRSLPTILMTANPSEELRHLAFEFGASDFVIKPLDIFQIRSRIADVLNAFFEQTRRFEGHIEAETLKRRASELRTLADRLDAEVDRIEDELGLAKKDEEES